MTHEGGAPEWGTTWPPFAEFCALGDTHRVVPVVRRLFADALTPVAVYSALAEERPGTFILESAHPDGSRSRFSFIGVHSRATLTASDGHARWHGDVPQGLTSGPPMEAIRSALEHMASEAIPGLPPLTGGLVGALGWDVVREWEPTLPANAPEGLALPDVVLLFATDIAAVDHVDGSVWLIANAVNADGAPERIDEAYADALTRLDRMQAALEEIDLSAVTEVDSADVDVPISAFTSPGEYVHTVEKAQEAIRDGEVFQVVPSQRFDVECAASPLDVYRMLRTLNPSPYLYYFQLEDLDGQPFAIVGSSPESLVTVRDRDVSTFPIAGSRPRGATPGADADLEKELRADPKEIAEHVMLVDLARNDLVKVCTPTSVEVSEFTAVHRYSHVMHICSTVVGTLEEQYTPVDAFMAVFPAGTLSGAPKPRAIALIDEYEPVRRGFYGGTVGYFDFAGNADLAIAIRTAVIRDHVAHVQAGAGIVADSVPEREEQETRDKAAAMVRAVAQAAQFSRVRHVD